MLSTTAAYTIAASFPTLAARGTSLIQLQAHRRLQQLQIHNPGVFGTAASMRLFPQCYVAEACGEVGAAVAAVLRAVRAQAWHADLDAVPAFIIQYMFQGAPGVARSLQVSEANIAAIIAADTDWMWQQFKMTEAQMLACARGATLKFHGEVLTGSGAWRCVCSTCSAVHTADELTIKDEQWRALVSAYVLQLRVQASTLASMSDEDIAEQMQKAQEAIAAAGYTPVAGGSSSTTTA